MYFFLQIVYNTVTTELWGMPALNISLFGDGFYAPYSTTTYWAPNMWQVLFSVLLLTLPNSQKQPNEVSIEIRLRNAKCVGQGKIYNKGQSQDSNFREGHGRRMNKWKELQIVLSTKKEAVYCDNGCRWTLDRTASVTNWHVSCSLEDDQELFRQGQGAKV